MKVLLDTNIIIDAYSATRPCHKYANILLEERTFGKFEACICSLSLKDVYYILCKIKPEPKVRNVIANIFTVANVLNVDEDILKSAILSDEPDFEDGIIRACAESNNIDFIITRDEQAYQTSTVRNIPSDDFCKNVLGIGTDRAEPSK